MTVTSHASRLLRTRLVLAVFVTISACGHLYRNGGNEEERAALVFANQSLDAADVFAIPTSGAAVRLGSVMAGRTDTLIVPRQILDNGGNVNIVARLLARSYAPQSGSVTIRPGDLLDVRLGLDARMLSVVPARQ